jgi:hypothetical protein
MYRLKDAEYVIRDSGAVEKVPLSLVFELPKTIKKLYVSRFT